MKVKPANVAELTDLLADACAKGTKVSSFDLSALNRVLDHKSEDMTATVEAGVILADLQKQLAARGQWLPVDPPNSAQLGIGALLATNASGPRRFGFGTVRDYVIGIKAVLADGRAIRSGGKVVKNVAGYDLMKLFIGSRGSLGVIVEATFKLRPLPEMERFIEARCSRAEDAEKLIETVLDSELMPAVLDLHNLSPATCHLALVLGFAGTREEVEWQLAKAAELGFTQPSSLGYDKALATEATTIRKASVLPSKTVEFIRALSGAPFVARAGNGIIYHRGPPPGAPASLPASLENATLAGRDAGAPRLAVRLKNEFDPKHILPDLNP
jgi:FAD/FMN-containing dehydrogenase